MRNFLFAFLLVTALLFSTNSFASIGGHYDIGSLDVAKGARFRGNSRFDNLPTATSGIGGDFYFPLTSGVNSDYSALGVASATEPKYQLAGTLGASLECVSQTTSSTTKYGKIVFEYTIPAHYRSGDNLVVTIEAAYTDGGGGDSATVDASVYEVAATGLFGSDLVTTAAQALTTSPAEYEFAVTGTSFVPGDRIAIVVTTSSTEVGGGSANTRLKSVKISD